MTPFDPLRVTLTLHRPMAVPQHPIHLDAVLAWAAVEQATQAGHDDPLSAQAALPLAQHRTEAGTVWCASQFLYAPLDTPQPQLLTKRFELDDLALMHGKVYEGGRNRIDPGTGHYKGFKLTVPTVWTGRLVAYCLGQRTAVAALLDSVPSIGKYGRLCFGAITDRRITCDERATDAWKLRVLPEPAPGLEAVEATIQPPYWRRECRQLAYRPLTFPPELLHDA